jgi:hypothetical protein
MACAHRAPTRSPALRWHVACARVADHEEKLMVSQQSQQHAPEPGEPGQPRPEKPAPQPPQPEVDPPHYPPPHAPSEVPPPTPMA